MGLKETIDTSSSSTLVASDSNGIDVHLQKNTEYGAAILLGASDYGKQGSDITARRMDKGSTTFGTDVQASSTGNVYGIYELGYYNMDTSQSSYEWVAGTSNVSRVFETSSIDKRYYDLYGNSVSTAKSGDATYETRTWHGSSGASWVSSSYPGFQRGYNGVFFYNNFSGRSDYGRSVVVVGDGF